MKDARLKVDLTKKRHTLLVKANEYVENIRKVKFCYVNIDCRSGHSTSFKISNEETYTLTHLKGIYG